ncbi:MAG: transaldolase family protein [Phycisphaeraceae bacterium]
MEFWLADADLDRVAVSMSSGIFAGVITNPAVVAGTGLPPSDLFAELCKTSPCCWYQLKHGSAEAMLKEAETMIAINPQRMRIKVPATRPGLQVIKQLQQQSQTVMATCVPTAAWMLLACAAGADYIAPYGGMLQKRAIHSKLSEVSNMQRVLDRQQLDTKICAGLYAATEIEDFSAVGVRAGFIWGKDVDDFLQQPLVEEAVAAFANDWQTIDQY